MKKIIFFIIFASLSLNGQEKLDRAIETLENSYTGEKVYLLTDKEEYIAGDIISFKSFVFSGYHKSRLSTTLFVELYDRDKKLLDSKTILLTNAEGSGILKLEENLPENIYYLRAYTPLMSSFSQEFDFIKLLPVYNALSTEKLQKKEDNSWTASVYPEGNSFIENSATKFAVRLNAAGTPPKVWSGYVIETGKPNDKVVSFKNLDPNVALFQLTAKENKNYRLIIEDDKGKNQEIDLPAATHSGVALQLKNTTEGIKYTLSSANLSAGLMNYKVIGTINNKMVYRGNIKKPVGSLSGTIPYKVAGNKNSILYLTVFDDKDIPVSQRLFFLKTGAEYVKRPHVENMMPDKNKRSLNSFNINTSSNPVTVLVKDASVSYADEVEGNNLLSYLWITGDFPTKIDTPSQYFSKQGNPEALDALLISENWKRFSWNSLMSGSVSPPKASSGEYLSFEGKLAQNSRALPNRDVALLFKNASGQMASAQTQTDSKGNIYINNVLIEEPMSVTYFLMPDKNNDPLPQNLTLKFKPLVNPTPYRGILPYHSYYVGPKTSDSKQSMRLERAFNNLKSQKSIKDNAILIEKINLIAQKQNATKKLEKDLTSGMFNTANSIIFDFVNENQNIGTGSILNWLQGRVAGLQMQRDGLGNLVPYMRDAKAKLFYDEIPTEPSMLESVEISSIAMVKVIKGHGWVGNAVLIYSKRGNMTGANGKAPVKDNEIMLKGYDKNDNFELINLSREIQEKLSEDSREVLYWNPAFLEKANSKIEFLNNDFADAFKILIIGFDEENNLLFNEETVKN
ncbi:hypothetical protein [Chryseobacterium sp.]|uniref:hypothetical protein n=1 Tax=Chryseobacterium sp. TaxID=1871047 RepID=UPI0011CC631C|nr:hypothetical protein [Chryseobacterium sp.]TXF78920.1 hypothetical protein FUA25_00560 [Chryseobacterium sp.]